MGRVVMYHEYAGEADAIDLEVRGLESPGREREPAFFPEESLDMIQSPRAGPEILGHELVPVPGQELYIASLAWSPANAAAIWELSNPYVEYSRNRHEGHGSASAQEHSSIYI